MKIKSSILAAAFALLAFSFAACSGGDSGGESSVSVTGVSISDKSVTTVFVDGTLQLSATVAPSDASNPNVTWASSNSNAASVDNTGLVTGKSAVDSVTITVTTEDGGFSDSLTIEVLAAPAIGSVSITSDLPEGSSKITCLGTANLTAALNDLTSLESSEITYAWEITEGGDYATLSESTSSTVTLTGKNLTADDASVTVKVTANYTYSDGTQKTKDATFTLNVEAGAKTKDFSDIFTSISSATLENEEIAAAALSGFAATITPKSAGETKLTVSGTTTDGTLEGYVLVTVASGGTITLGEFRETSSSTLVTKIEISGQSSIVVGSTTELSAKVKPSNATNQNVTWSSSDMSVATVDENGKVTGVSNGSAVITAEAADGSGVKGELELAVTGTGSVKGTVY